MDNEVKWRSDHPCPDARQTVFYPVPRCNLNDKPCMLSEENECPTYEDYLFETRQEELDNR